VTLFPVFSLICRIFFWFFLVEAFMFLGQIIIVYAYYNVWDKLSNRKTLRGLRLHRRFLRSYGVTDRRGRLVYLTPLRRRLQTRTF